MRYASVCDGIGAVHVAWQGLPLECAWRSEIERFPEAVVSHRFPNIGPNLGDMTKITDEEIARHGPIDLLVGGTPCPSFSLAGLRRGMADPGGNLALTFLDIARRSGARYVLWENVCGVLSSNGGRDFGAFLGGLAELGFGFCYRVLDSRWFGVPQRRRRVFVVGHLGDWRRAAAVLFERESLRGDREEGREELASALAYCIRASAGRMMWDGADNVIREPRGLRRLTPMEHERLMGFPDDYTLAPYRGKLAADGPRYRALGNSMAVPVMRYIGERLVRVDALAVPR